MTSLIITVKKVDEDRFVNIFSDDDVSDDDATSDSDGVDDVMDGITLFLRAVDERREARQRCRALFIYLLFVQCKSVWFELQTH